MIPSIVPIFEEAAFCIAKTGALAFCASTIAGIFAIYKANLASLIEGKSRGYQEPTACLDGSAAKTSKKIALAACLYCFFKL